MIRFYFHPTPNPAKVALFLEEAGLPYETMPVDTSKGEQHLPTFRAINPNGKVPAIVDTAGPGGKEARVFDSTAILLYLAEKTGKFLGTPEDRPELPVLAAVHRLRTRSVFGPGRAFSIRGTRPSRRARVHRWQRLHDRGHVGLGMARPGFAGEGSGGSLGSVSEPEALLPGDRCAAGRAAGQGSRTRPRVQEGQ